MESKDFNIYEQKNGKIIRMRSIKVGDKMAGRYGNRGVVSIVVPQEDTVKFDELKADLIFNNNTSEMYTVHYLKESIFIGSDTDVLTNNKKYYIINETENEYVVLNDKDDEISVTKEKFQDVV